MIAPLIIISVKSKKKTMRVLRSHSRNSFFQPDDRENLFKFKTPLYSMYPLDECNYIWRSFALGIAKMVKK